MGCYLGYQLYERLFENINEWIDDITTIYKKELQAKGVLGSDDKAVENFEKAFQDVAKQVIDRMKNKSAAHGDHGDSHAGHDSHNDDHSGDDDAQHHE